MNGGTGTIGYKHSVSIAFAVEDEQVLILGIFYAGRDVAADLLEERR